MAVAVTAWFGEDADLDAGAYESHCDWIVRNGAGALVVNGSAGEYEALPVIAYNNPFATRIDRSPALLARVAGIPDVVAVKEFSQDVRRVTQIRRLAPELTAICGVRPAPKGVRVETPRGTFDSASAPP